MTQKQRIISKLRRGRPVHSWVLARYCLQYNTRIKELRAMGFLIDPCMIGKQNGFKLLTPVKEIDFKKCKLREIK